MPVCPQSQLQPASGFFLPQFGQKLPVIPVCPQSQLQPSFIALIAGDMASFVMPITPLIVPSPTPSPTISPSPPAAEPVSPFCIACMPTCRAVSC